MYTAKFLYGELFNMTKFPYNKISIRRNILRRFFFAAKFPYGKISLRCNSFLAKITTAKYPTAKFPTAKFPVTGKNITDVEMMKLLSTGSKLTIHYWPIHRYFMEGLLLPECELWHSYAMNVKYLLTDCANVGYLRLRLFDGSNLSMLKQILRRS